MSKLKEILENENAPRETSLDKRTVRLVKMGAFIRAYDWSAWLLKRYGSPLKAGLDTADGSTHVFVGFPIMRQHSSCHLRFHLVQTRLQPFMDYGHFDTELTKFIPSMDYHSRR